VSPHGNLTRDEMEARRLKAARLLKAGISPGRVAETFEVSRTTAYRWEHLFLEQGRRGMKKRIPSGRPPKLDEQQLESLRELCKEGPQAAGYDHHRWTTELLADAILRQFHVRYDSDHVGRMLRHMGVEWIPGHRQKARSAN
jgi:transposase